VLLSAISKDKLVQLPRTFDNAMGLASSHSQLAVACKSEVVVVKNFPQLATNYPANPNTYDAFFVPVQSFHTGNLNLHDMNFIDGRLVAINTLFSCLAEIKGEYSFHPIWQPKYISKLEPEDRCHLNGMAVHDNSIEYVTALGTTDTLQGWRDNKMKGGVVIHVPTGEVVISELSMPHSPRMYDGDLFFLNSAQGELRMAYPKEGSSEVLTELGGFARGMARLGDYVFVGISKLRHTTDEFRTLPIAETSFSGMVIVHLPSGQIAGKLEYLNSVEEIYDVKILPDIRRPGILNTLRKESKLYITTPESTYWATDKEG
jgi:uncharacterized protein (TIGR03032 family)